MKLPNNKCWICNTKYPLKVMGCWKCAFNKKYGVWIDLRKKKDLNLLNKEEIDYLIKIGALKDSQSTSKENTNGN